MAKNHKKNAVLKKGARLVQKGDYESALKHYNSAMNYDPLHAWYGKGLLYAGLGDEKQALNYFNRALINIDFVPALVERGKLFRRIKNYECAQESFERALKIVPHNPHILYEKAHLLKELKEYADASLLLNDALTIMPELKEAWHDMGDIFLIQGKTEDAYGFYSKALELDPDFFPSWVGSGLVFQDLKQFEDALICYENAQDINPNYNYSNLFMAHAYTSLRDFENALKFIDKFQSNIRLQPEAGSLINRSFGASSDAWYEKGNILCQQGDLEEGINCLDKAATTRPESFYVWWTKGDILKNIGQYHEAIECFEKSIELNEDFIMAWESMAMSLSLSGEEEKYIKCCDFINNDLNDPLLHETNETIKNDLKNYYKYKYMESLPLQFSSVFEEEDNLVDGTELELIKQMDDERKGEFVPEFDVRNRVFFFAVANIPLGLLAVACAMIYGSVFFLIAIVAIIFSYKIFTVGQAKQYHFNNQRKLFVIIGATYGVCAAICAAVMYFLFQKNPDHFFRWISYHTSRFDTVYNSFYGVTPDIPDPFIALILMVSCFVVMVFAFYIASDPRFIFKYAKGTEPTVYNHNYFY